jgi:hypothetical protein
MALPHLIEVCLFFENKNPSEVIYTREIPLKVSTKFIEENIAILRELLDSFLLNEMIKSDETNFFERFYLKRDCTRIRIRLLDDVIKTHLLGSTFISDLEVPISELDELLLKRSNLLSISFKKASGIRIFFSLSPIWGS